MNLFERPFDRSKQKNEQAEATPSTDANQDAEQSNANSQEERDLKRSFDSVLGEFFDGDYLKREGIRVPQDSLERVQKMLAVLGTSEIRRMMGIKGDKNARQRESLERESSEANQPARSKEDVRQAARLLAQGAVDRLRFDGGLTGGYYGSSAANEEGEDYFDARSVDISRWARKAVWGKAGLDKPQDSLSTEEEIKLTEGYLAAELGTKQFDKWDLSGQGAFATFEILAALKSESPRTLALLYGDLFREVRSHLNTEETAQFDDHMTTIGLKWNEQESRFDSDASA